MPDSETVAPVERTSSVDASTQVLRSLAAPTVVDRNRYYWLAVGFVVQMLAVGGRWDLSLAAWLAPIFLIRFARSSRAAVAVVGIMVTSVTAGLFWFFQVAVPLTPTTLAGAFVFGVVLGLPYIVDRFAGPSLPVVGRILAFAATLAATEFVLGVFSPFGTAYGLLAVTQHSHLDLLQITSITGPYAIGFLIGTVGTAVNYWWEAGFSVRAFKVPAAVLAIVFAVVAFGQARMAWTPASSAPIVSVAGINPDARLLDRTQAVTGVSFQDPVKLAGVDPATLRTAFTPTNDQLLADTVTAALGGAKVVTWSENAARVAGVDEQSFIAAAAAVARQNKIYLNAAMVVVTDDGWTNKDEAVFFGPDGSVLSTYRKHHPIPGLEPYEPGTGAPPVIDTPYGKIATIICYDADFPALPHIDTDILLMPGGDWDEIGWIHTKMASLRGIENGYSIVRDAYDGSSQAFDRNGNVLGIQDTTQDAVRIWYVDVPVDGGGKTFYNVAGDWFAWLSVIAAVGLGALAFTRRRSARASSTHTSDV